MDEALKYGFRRVTPMDDCSDQFQGMSYLDHKTLNIAKFAFQSYIYYFSSILDCSHGKI